MSNPVPVTSEYRPVSVPSVFWSKGVNAYSPCPVPSKYRLVSVPSVFTQLDLNLSVPSVMRDVKNTRQAACRANLRPEWCRRRSVWFKTLGTLTSSYSLDTGAVWPFSVFGTPAEFGVRKRRRSVPARRMPPGPISRTVPGLPRFAYPASMTREVSQVSFHGLSLRSAFGPISVFATAREPL
jgi:hypothetical protein